MLKIKTRDKIIIRKGKDKGKSGTILKIIKKNQCNGKNNIYVLIEGINVYKKHIKHNPNKNKSGGILDINVPIFYSNVSILNVITNKVDRVGFKFLNGKKVRFYKSNGELVN